MNAFRSTPELPETTLADHSSVDIMLNLPFDPDNDRWDVVDWQPSGLTVRPRRLKMVFSPSPQLGGRWVVGMVVVGGPRVQKNGSLTKQDQLVRWSNLFSDEVMPEEAMPDWMDFLVRREFTRFQDAPQTAPKPSLEERVARLESIVGQRS